MKNKKTRKRVGAAGMITVIMLGCVGNTAGNVKVQAEESNVFASLNPGFNEAGEDAVPYWWYGSSTDISVVEDVTAEGGKCVKVTPSASGKWVGCATNATEVLEDGVTYGYSFYAKLDADSAAGGTTMVAPVINRIFDENYSETDQDTQVNQEEVTLSSEEWTKVTGSFTIDYNPSGVKEAVMQHFILNGNGTGTFYVDNLSVVETEKAPIVIEDITPLKEHFAKESTIAGKAGVAIPVSALSDDARMELVTKHYNSITCENEMKPDSFLGSAPTYKTDENGNVMTTEDGEPALQLNFSQADAIMDYVKNYNEAHPDDVIRVRGHVLVWHSQTPDWFFREGYSKDGAYVSKEKMLSRMENYIKEVMAHYEGEDSPYRGIIYAWDVVNEQIETADYDAKTNPGSLRVNCNGTTTGWYNVFGGNNSYITQAFVYANKYAPSEVKLFYNDYGDTDPAKRDAICELLKEIKNTAGARIDGMGMQAHYSMDSPSVSLIEEAVRKYSAVVGEVQLTELDLQSSKNYDGSDKQAELTKEGYRYKEIFEALCRLDKEEGIDITAITLWGTDDGHTWLQSSSAVGGGADGNRPQVPLLFDYNYKAKPAYWGIVDASKLEPFINKISVRYSDKEDFDEVEPVTYQSAVGEITFRALWNEDGMKVKVDVPDVTKDETDKVVIYAKSPGNAFSVTRREAVETENGYQAIVTIPADKLGEMSVGTSLAFDVAVFDKEVQMSWNDLTNSQASDSKYYGEVVCKPYMEVPKGTPTIDGVCEEEWEKTIEVPLTIVTGSPKATGTVRVMWDSEYLYAYFNVTDPEVSKTSANAYEQDSVEVFVDQNNGKTGSYEADDSQYRINFENEASFNGVNCKAQNLCSAARKTDTGYVIELGIKWVGTAPKANDLLGLEFQINDGISDGSRIGTVSWYDEKGTGYQDPSVFGTVKLVEKPDSEDKDDASQKDDTEKENTADGLAQKISEAETGAVITNVISNEDTRISKEVMGAAKGKDVTLRFELGNGVVWSINGKNIREAKDIDLSVALNTKNIPQSAINAIGDDKAKYQLQISLAHEGDLGMEAALRIPLGASAVGYYANLYYYNPATGKLEFMESMKVGDEGNAEFKFNHASDYVIVVSENDESKLANTNNQTASQQGSKTVSKIASQQGSGSAGQTVSAAETSVKTGDTANIAGYLLLFGAAIVCALAGGWQLRKNR